MRLNKIVFLLLVSFGMACSRFEIVQTTLQVPPQNPGALAKINRMAVIDFGSDRFPEVADTITNKLIERLIKTKKLEIVEREKVKRLVDEQKFQTTDHVDSSTIIEAGRILGVDHLLLGTVLAFQAVDEHGSFTDMESVQEGFNTIYVDGRPVEVPRWVQVPIQRNFRVRKVVASINFRVVDAQTGTVRIADSITRSYTSQRAIDGRALMDQHQLLDDLLEQSIAAIMTHFDWHTQRLECMLSKRKGMAKGNKFLKNGLLLEAEELYDLKSRKNSNNPDVNYNLGVVKEVRGDLHAAEEHFKKAFMADDNCEIFQNRLRIVRAKLAKTE